MKWHYKLFSYLTILSFFGLGNFAHSQEDVDPSWSFNRCFPACCSPCGNLSLFADYLYWKPQGSNLIYDADVIVEGFAEFDKIAPTEEVPFETDVSSFRVHRGFKKKSLNYKWDSGVRVGFIYDIPCSCWQFRGDWTHHNSRATGSECRDVCGCTSSTFQKPFEICPKWNLYLDWFDLSFAKRCTVGECFTVTPYIGFRYARVHQKYTSEAEGAFALAEIKGEVDCYDFEVAISEKHKYNGVGPRIGLNFHWDWWCGLSFYGDAAVSGTVGYTDHKVGDRFVRQFASQLTRPTKTRQLYVENNEDIDRVFERDEHLQANRWITDLALGVQWAPCFRCGCFNLIFQLGWEHHAFFNQKHAHFGQDFPIDEISLNPIILNTSIPRVERTLPGDAGFCSCRSTLAVQGLVFRVIVDF